MFATILGKAVTLASSGYRFLLRATFSSDIAAPLPASLPVDVGGPLTTVQVDGQLSQSGGTLVFPVQATPIWGDQGFYLSALTRVAGRALLFDITKPSTATAGPVVGWFTAATTNPGSISSLAIYVNGANVQAILPATTSFTIGAYAAATPYMLVVILRSTGQFFLIKGGIYTQWILLWVDNAGSTTPVYAAMTNYNASGTLDNFRVIDLPQFASDDMIYTNRLVSPAVNATTTSTANMWMEWSGLVPAAVSSTQIDYRISDASNNWSARIHSNGSIYLLQTTAGAATQRGTIAHGLASGAAYRFVVITDGNVHKLYVNTTLLITYTDGTNQGLTATDVKVTFKGTSDTLSEVICWPRAGTLPAGI